ncbi:hypothetical protein [Rhodococcus sp. T2V]|nr:hypothetical protein [Rhodococcus sp. T2V]
MGRGSPETTASIPGNHPSSDSGPICSTTGFAMLTADIEVASQARSIPS